MSLVASVTAELYNVPLAEILVDAKHGSHTHFELVVAKIVTADGDTGVGYTYTGGRGGRAIHAMVQFDLAPVVVGMDAARIEAIWNKMEWHAHYVGRGGILSFAMSAVDIALWDLKCRRAREPLWKVIGGAHDTVKCYAGGIDLEFEVSKLIENVKAYIADGHTAVKIKLGKPNLEEDLARVAAVREAIGPDATLMVDANMSWSTEHAIRAARRLQDYNVLWLEEPTIPDDYSAYGRIRKEAGLALAQGENLHTVYEFKQAIASSGVDFPQPDASNIGGITGWIKVAHLAEAHNLPVCSHGMQELHVSLLAGVVNQGWMEVHSFPIDQYTLAGKVAAVNGLAKPPNTPGTGVEFDWAKLAPYKILL